MPILNHLHCQPHKSYLNLTTKRFAINESIPNAGRGLIPDYVVHPTITNLVEGKDVILEKALDVIQGN
jgi:hypothetical protein